MMISPECFYDMECKGKSYNELLKVVRKLRREIDQNKHSLEEAYLKDDSTEEICPSPLVQCLCTYDYLEMAKRAIVEIGGEYPQTTKEKKSEEFNANLDYIKTFEFQIGGFFDGMTIHRIEFDDGMHYKLDHLYMSDRPFEPELPYSKEEFIKVLKDLRMGEWRRNYNNPDVMDGTQWEVSVEFSNGTRMKYVYGCNAYPWNFEKLQEIFE